MNNYTNDYTVSENKELSFQDLINILKKYKWSILFITLIFILSTYSYLYFKPLVYSSSAIIEIKPSIHGKTEDLINNTTSMKKFNVSKEISLLKTFNINKYALEKIHFKIQYFKTYKYKDFEIYNTIPLKIIDIKFIDKKLIDKKLTIIPQSDGYSIRYQASYKEKIKKILFDTDYLVINNKKIFPYNKPIKTNFLHITVKKVKDIQKPIHFIIHGSTREIFENFIKYKLDVRLLEKKASLIQINYQDSIPSRAQLYVNTLIDSFIKHNIHNKNKRNNKTLTFIIEELKIIKKELKDSEQQLEKYQVSKSLLKPSKLASVYINKLSDIEIQISENNLKKKLILNLIKFVENNYNLDAIAPSLSKLDDKNTLRLIDKLQDYQLNESTLILEYTDVHPKILSLRKQIQNVRNKIEYNLKSLSTNIEYENQNFLKRKSTYDNDLKKLPSQERQLVNITRNYEVKSRMYEYLLKKQAENKIVQLATFSDYQIIDNAYSSDTPNKTKKLMIILLNALAGFIIGSLVAFIRNSSRKNIQNKEELEKLTSLPIYGTIPYYKQKNYQLQSHMQAKSPFTESFRTLRTNLQFISQKNKATIILITSTVAGEGKSTNSVNLATIMEMAKYKTLIINLDLRKPTLHKFFDINNEKGISSYLSGQNTIEEIILSTEFANLDIIPSGPIPSNPAELILSKELPILFNKLRNIYEYIIIDTAPIGIISDTKMLMQYSDLNLMIIREDYAKKEFIATLEKIIKKHNFKNVGLILNASKERGGEYGYGYSYEYK